MMNLVTLILLVYVVSLVYVEAICLDMFMQKVIIIII